MIKSDHVTLPIKSPQWFSISLEEKAKVFTMAHKALHDLLTLTL